MPEATRHPEGWVLEARGAGTGRIVLRAAYRVKVDFEDDGHSIRSDSIRSGVRIVPSAH
jgi:hypothetical protein